MTKNKAYFVRKIMELQGENPDDPEQLETATLELSVLSVTELLHRIQKLKDDGCTTRFTFF